MKMVNVKFYLLNGYVMTAGEVQELKLNAQYKHCSAKHEK